MKSKSGAEIMIDGIFKIWIEKCGYALVFMSVALPSQSEACSPAPPPVYEVQSDRVYLCESAECVLLPDADAKTFKTIMQGYGKDKNSVFYGKQRIEGANPSSFQFLGGISLLIGPDGYSKDKSAVFYLGEKLASADPGSFVLVGTYGKDMQSVYYQGKQLTGADSKTFQLVGDDYYKDKHSFYTYGKVLASDDTTQARTDHEFLINRDKVYRFMQLTPYDGSSFNVLATQSDGDTCTSHETTVLASDKNGMYYQDKKLAYSLTPTTESTLYVDTKNQSLYSLTRDEGLKKLQVNLHKTRVYPVRGVALVVDKQSNTAYLINEYGTTKIDTTELKLDIQTLQPYMKFDDVLWLRDKQQFYELMYQLEPQPVDAQSTLIFFDPELLVFRQVNGGVLTVDQNSVTEARTIDQARYQLKTMVFVKSNPILKRKGIEEGIFMVNNALIFYDGSLKSWITPTDHQCLQAYVVQPAEFEQLRENHITEWEKQNVLSW